MEEHIVSIGGLGDMPCEVRITHGIRLILKHKRPHKTALNSVLLSEESCIKAPLKKAKNKKPSVQELSRKIPGRTPI